jgi:hypothetical protein
MATKKMGKAPKDLLAFIRQKIKDEGREARVFPENVDLSKGTLPQTFTLLPEEPEVVEIPISKEAAQRSIKGEAGYREGPDGLVWDVMSFKAKHEGIEKVVNIDSDNSILLEQMVAALDSGDGKPVRVTIEMRPSKSHPGQQYKNVRVLGTED